MEKLTQKEKQIIKELTAKFEEDESPYDYAFKDNSEFIAMSMTSPEFQQFLSLLDSNETNLLQQIKDKLYEIFVMIASKVSTFLKNLLKVKTQKIDLTDLCFMKLLEIQKPI